MDRRPRSRSLSLREYQLLRSNQEVDYTYYLFCWGSFFITLTTIVYIGVTINNQN